MALETLAVPIFSKYFNRFSDFLVSKLLSKISKKNRIWIAQEDKDQLASGLRIATRSIRYALKNHNGKRQLKFGLLSPNVDPSSQNLDSSSLFNMSCNPSPSCVADWLEYHFLDFYYATLNKKIKEQIEIIIDLHDSLSRFYCYSYSFFDDGSADSAYSERYSQKNSNPENIKKGQEIADETFEMILPNLLKAYIELIRLLQREGIID